LNFMHCKVSFAVFLYATTAVIDAILGISALNQFESYLFKFAAAAAIIAIYISLTGKGKPIRALPFILASLFLSIIVITLGRTDLAIPINMTLKVTAIVFTLKPEIIEVEIITEEELQGQSRPP